MIINQYTYGFVNKKYDNIIVDSIIQKAYELCVNKRIIFISNYLTSQDNWIADDLSRFRVDKWKFKVQVKGLKIKPKPVFLPLIHINYYNKFSFN